MDFVRVKVTDAGGSTVYDSDTNGNLLKCSITLNVSFAADTFSIVIDNSGFDYNTTFTIYDDVEVWMGASSPGTKYMFGRLKRIEPDHSGFKRSTLKLSGVDYSELLMRIHTTDTYTYNVSPCTSSGCEISIIVDDLMSTYAQSQIGFTTYVDTTTKFYATGSGEAIQFKQKKVWDAIKELALAAGFVAYVDSAKELHFEEKSVATSGQVLNAQATGSEYAIDKMSFSSDGSTLATRVIVYGDSTVPIIKQVDALDKQELYQVIEEIYQDNSITDSEWAKDIARERVNLFSQVKTSYKVESPSYVAGINPGELIRVINGDYGVDEDMVMYAITYSIDNNWIRTSFLLNEFPTDYIDFVKKMSEEISRLKVQNQGIGTIDKIIQFYETITISDSAPTFDVWAPAGDYVYAPFSDTPTKRKGKFNLAQYS